MNLMQRLFPRHLIGLDIGVSGIKAVQLSGSRTPRLSSYNRVPLPVGAVGIDGEIKQAELVSDALRNLFASRVFTSKKVAVGASGKSVMTKRISLPKMSDKELSNTLYFEAEQYIPFGVDEVNIDYAVLGPSPGTAGTTQMDVLLVAAKKEYIAQLSAVVESAGLNPALIDLQPFALGNAFEYNYGYLIGKRGEETGSSLVLDFGAGSTKVSLVEGDKTTFARELRGGGNGCTTMISERLGVGFFEAEKAKLLESGQEPYRTIVAEYVHMICEEIGRTLDLVLGASIEKGLSGVFICGGASRTHGLKESLEQRLPAPVQVLNPVQNIAGSGRKLQAQAVRELAYLGAVAVGLALRSVGDRA